MSLPKTKIWWGYVKFNAYALFKKVTTRIQSVICQTGIYTHCCLILQFYKCLKFDFTCQMFQFLKQNVSQMNKFIRCDSGFVSEWLLF